MLRERLGERRAHSPVHLIARRALCAALVDDHRDGGLRIGPSRDLGEMLDPVNKQGSGVVD
ncbi:hypothetical protein NJB1907Z4_C19930 [Mycobacterium pseudoshottsii]|uniref:Uncharacterized protein n=1 Tax=Mycobacterium pseudoshottsii TaxID=265949 RepID=A0A9N7LSF1_9MYCO|nr:hypothetical protein NJB1907Z4_C19930 [Mycobacterium pseudoshottsii]